MTEKEYQDLRTGDTIFSLKKKEGYVVAEKSDGHITYEGTPWNGSFPKSHLLQWDYVVLTKHDAFSENDNVKKARGILRSIIDQPNIAEEENRWQLWAKIWEVINLIS